MVSMQFLQLSINCNFTKFGNKGFLVWHIKQQGIPKYYYFRYRHEVFFVLIVIILCSNYRRM